ncbi:MAG TPA: hypothetical protein VJT15_24890 [Pyrinomonadaceae bacterium]|nr:hypothetical protein [Pyrinomonadaceae bacterium]
MPTKTERIKVEVTDSTEGDTRTFNINMTAATGDFQLSDLLQQRGVISALNGELKRAVRIATEAYLSGAEELLATLKQGATTTLNTRSNGKQQASNRTRKPATAASTSELNESVIHARTAES